MNSNRMRQYTALLCLGITLGLAGCLGDNGNDTSADQKDPVTATATGHAQKGPFQPGGTASAFALAADGSRGAGSVTGAIGSNGSFNLTDIDWTGPTDLEMSGSFYNEYTGNFTMSANGQTALHGLAVVPDDAQASVNLFTHFIAARVHKLMDGGAAFADARIQARGELGTIMGIDAAPSTLDLLHDDGNAAHEDDSANLLLFSAATLAADVDQAGIDAIATDFADDGQINGGGQNAFDAIRQATVDHPDLLTTARTNLQNQYGVTPPNNTGSLDPAWVPGVPAAPVAAFTTSGPLKVGEMQSFDAGDSTGNGLTYAWVFDDGASANGVQATHTYANAGSYAVILTVTDGDNRTATDSRELIITEVATTPQPPTANFSVSGSQFTDQDLTFNAGDSTGASLIYAWTFGDGSMASGAEVTHAYANPGDYTVELTVTDSANQQDTQTQSLTITPPPRLSGQKVTGDDSKEGDRFGVTIDIDGDTAVIGADRANIDSTGLSDQKGAAYVFARGPDGAWSQQAKLSASDGEAMDWFGSEVAISGDTIAISAPKHEVERSRSSQRTGVVYVFTRAADGSWNQHKKFKPRGLTRSGGFMNEVGFGASLALSGNTLLVGNNVAVVTGEDSTGNVYVYTRSGGDWSEQTRLWPGDEVPDDRFGKAVALDGDTAIVGAPTTPGAGQGPGSAYVFTRSGNSWNEQAKLIPNERHTGDRFGATLDVSGDKVVIGSPGATVDSNTRQGAAYVFTRSDNSWSQQGKLTLSQGKKKDSLAASVAITGNHVMLSTFYQNGWDQPTHVFTYSGGTWNENPRFSDAETGSTVGVDGNTTMIGAFFDNKKTGAVYFYDTSDLVQ